MFDKLHKFDTSSDGDKITLFSLSTNIARGSDLESSGEAHQWTSSIDSLNHFGSELSKSSPKREDKNIFNDHIQEEDKDDDLERDIDRDHEMEVEECAEVLAKNLILRKRPSCSKNDANGGMDQIIQQNEDYLFPLEDFLESRRTDIGVPKRMSKLTKMRSVICDKKESKSDPWKYSKSPLLSIRGRIDMSGQQESYFTRKSKKLRRSIRKEMKFDDFAPKKSDCSIKMTLCQKETPNPFLCQPVSNTENIE